MKRIRRTKDLKFKVALEAIKGNRQISEIAAEFQVHPNQISVWKKQLLEKGADVFDSRKESKKQEESEVKDALFRTIGHQQVQIGFLKKKLGLDE